MQGIRHRRICRHDAVLPGRKYYNRCRFTDTRALHTEKHSHASYRFKRFGMNSNIDRDMQFSAAYRLSTHGSVNLILVLPESEKVVNSIGVFSVSFANHDKPPQLELQHAYPYHTAAHGSILMNPTDILTDTRQNYHKCPRIIAFSKIPSSVLKCKGQPNHPPPTINYG